MYVHTYNTCKYRAAIILQSLIIIIGLNWNRWNVRISRNYPYSRNQFILWLKYQFTYTLNQFHERAYQTVRPIFNQQPISKEYRTEWTEWTEWMNDFVFYLAWKFVTVDFDSIELRLILLSINRLREDWQKMSVFLKKKNVFERTCNLCILSQHSLVRKLEESRSI